MPNPEQNVVTQADREAAADVVSGILSDITCEHIRSGRYDGDRMVQTCVQHRIKATRALALSNLASLDGETLDLCSGAVIPAGELARTALEGSSREGEA